ncbi:extracellular solute-binding protein [Neobacillus drentensis]|uniref:extracellular solute-binding protein n=1 Tax=Neobacillus drentensis TaxID=220684 RepID=UPI001F313731|nr:extracellular solute-binding protein [Neobacillus drentensis]ULT58718.1 extracellular solute-binding protein [Neobacillus drentensis]
MKNRRNMKKWVALGLAAVLSASITGCSMETANNTTKAVDVPKGLWDPYKKEVTLTTVVEQNAGTNFQKGDSYDHNPWYRAYKDRFNVKVKNLWVSNDYTTKLNLSIADGKIPDVFHVNTQQLVQLQQSGLIMDLTDLFNKYGSDTLKSYMKNDKDTYKTAVLDGKLYGIPQLNYGIIDQFNYVWIRKDWKEKLGLKDPKTMDDVVNVAKAFQKNFGGYPITETKTLDTMNRLAVAWGAHPGIWVKKQDGTIAYGSVQPEMKQVLSDYARWFKDGLINPEFTTYDQQKMFQDVINGKTGVAPMAQWFGYLPGPDIVKNQGPNAIFEPYAIPSANGAEVKGSVSFGNRGYIVISKNAKNPEAALKLINFFAYMMDDAAGKEKPEFISSLFDNNYPNIPYGLNVINPLTDYNQFVKIKEAIAKGNNVDVTELGKDASKYNSIVNWKTKKDPNGVGDFLQQGNDKSAYGIAKNYLDNGNYVKNALWGSGGKETETLMQYGSTLNDILTEGFTKIITGEEKISYFDSLVEQWEKAGGAQATKEVNKAYGNK